MMKVAIWAALALGAVGGLGGCGTWMNLVDLSAEPLEFIDRQPNGPMTRVYGGVKLDTAFAQDSFKAACQGSSNGLQDNFFNFCCGTVALADVPVSVVADTLTLPITFCWRPRQSGDGESPGPCSPPALGGMDAVTSPQAGGAVPINSNRSP
jgi:uncharacterized protein YceK